MKNGVSLVVNRVSNCACDGVSVVSLSLLWRDFFEDVGCAASASVCSRCFRFLEIFSPFSSRLFLCFLDGVGSDMFRSVDMVNEWAVSELF